MALTVCALPSHAESNSKPMGSKYNALYADCLNEYETINNTVVIVCSETVSEQAKTDITRHYRSIYARLKAANPEDAAQFEASQQAWLRYRNAHCALTVTYIGTPMMGYCPMELNSRRAVELSQMDSK